MEQENDGSVGRSLIQIMHAQTAESHIRNLHVVWREVILLKSVETVLGGT